MQNDSCLYESYSLIVRIEQVNNCKITIFDESNEEKEHVVRHRCKGFWSLWLEDAQVVGFKLRH